MEIDLSSVTINEPTLPEEYRWVEWSPEVLERHALVKHESFSNELDSIVFPCLGDITGCRRLMEDISHQKNFVPAATWLIMSRPHQEFFGLDCGTIQGIVQSSNLGAIQNVGVIPEHRGQGLGRALVCKSLLGFQSLGIRRVYLEVTAQNRSAVELYHRIGFRILRTLYKAVETLPAEV
ncbi:MAG: GNAT family N-acetyltransferase [Planctomycetaceae bacterium]|nr:GNAT family N-acetyltransferase [Planctomycetaceae bacterium]